MSLINQMLQDLDARSPDGAGSAHMHSHVKVVPERGGIHAAWWLVLVLGIMLSAVIAWLYLKEPSGMALASSGTPPPASRLGLEQVASQKNREEDNHDAIAPDVNLPSAAMRQASAETRSNNPSKETLQTSVSKEVPYSQVNAASAIGSVAASKPAVAEPVRPMQKRMQEDSTKAPEANSLVSVDKHVSELTRQQRAENEYRKAASQIQSGSVLEAIATLEGALQLDPLHALARQTLVGVLLDGKRHEEAARKLQEGLSLDPRQASMAMILARLQVEKGELQAAVETLQRTLPYDTDRADYCAFLAALLQRQARHKDAIAQYIVALRKMPQNAVWWMGLGISLQAENRTAEAREAFGRAKASNTLSPELQAFVEQKIAQIQR